MVVGFGEIVVRWDDGFEDIIVIDGMLCFYELVKKDVVVEGMFMFDVFVGIEVYFFMFG